MPTSNIINKTIKKPNYEQLISFDDDKINVMLLGVSGCGKSTLINALLGEELAETGIGSRVTNNISVYECEEYSVRLIDTVGYEFGMMRQNKIKSDLAKFSKEGVKRGDVTKLIHMIWFCIDGTNKRIDQDVLKYIKSVSNDWKNVPIIIVITKSYSEKEIPENVQMVRNAIETYNAKHKRSPIYIRNIIPVVAKPYVINNTTTIPTSGLDNLMAATNTLAPEAKKIAKTTIKEIDLKLKKNSANIILGAATSAAAVIGAIDIANITDAAILVPTQTLMLQQLSKTYGVSNKSQSQEIINTVMRVGGTTIIGKALISAIKTIPGLNIAGAVLNAVVASSVTFALGETSMNLFEKVYSGAELTDVEQSVTESINKFLPDIILFLSEYIKSKNGKLSKENIIEFVSKLLEKTVAKKTK